MQSQQQTFNNLSIFWKTLVVIGTVSTIIFLILLVIIVSLMFESKLNKKESDDVSEYDDFLNEFKNGKNNKITDLLRDSENEASGRLAVLTTEDYPVLPKIKDFEGNFLRNLLQIEIIN